MNKKELQLEIEQLIQSIKLHYHRIDEEVRIPTIELELITAKIRKLYEKSILFNHLHYLEEQGYVTITQKQFDDELESRSFLIHKETTKQMVSPVPAPLPEPVQVESSITLKPNQEQNSSVKDQISEEPKTKVAEVIQETTPEEKVETVTSPTPIENIVSEKPVINEPVKPIDSEPEKVQTETNLKDLNSFISLNNKYMFMSKLFWGNADEYRNSITQMNQCQTAEESKKLLQALAEKYKWQKDSEAVEEFSLCVFNRFKLS
jgi:hypothetical protein